MISLEKLYQGYCQSIIYRNEAKKIPPLSLRDVGLLFVDYFYIGLCVAQRRASEILYYKFHNCLQSRINIINYAQGGVDNCTAFADKLYRLPYVYKCLDLSTTNLQQSFLG